ncbi:putative quinol monooxygenase [Mucilaginibacter terrae]|uniref:Quinol monooxygenase YgiN n=1 Tax=Mucilaginibacter terrae TaxID=1955052 RepID=A0ABU3H0P1_9SPHI|nr:antibiotic biosynthesis monooxygenase [Mucilaginibacter terrae]MDT3405446.1 quinol monooxygenase YgiN [Mucilaginibacter terrae]
MKKTNKVTVLAEYTILPGFEKEVMEAAEIVWLETLKEPGCESYFFTTRKESPNAVFCYEVFRSQAEFDQHLSADYTQDFLEKLKGKVEGGVRKTTFVEDFEHTIN